MLAPTHLIAGQTAYVAASLAAGHTPTMWEAWTAAAVALLPDLDKRNGVVGRLFPYLSEPLEFRFGHRTMTHSLLVGVALAAVLWPVLPFGWWLAAVAGYGSHPVADMMTPAGVAWLWPARWRCVLPGNERYRMQAMGWGELAFAVILGCATAVMVPLAQADQGAGGILKAAIGDIGEARARYDAEKGGNAWTLRVQGRDNRSYADIAGDYLVLGPWQASGFIVRDGAGVPRSVCRSDGCDWYAEHAVAVQGADQATDTRELVLEVSTVGALRRALEPLEAAGDVYLSGTVIVRGVTPQPPTVGVSGDTVSLAYATPSVLATWPDGPVGRVALTVQVRHAPGGEVPALAVRPLGAEPIPALLRRWVE